MSSTSATTVQRFFRGWKVRQDLPKIRAKYYEKNAGEGHGHMSLARRYGDYNCDWLNGSYSESHCHHFWGDNSQPQRRTSVRVSFNDTTLETGCPQGVGETNFAPRGDSPSWTFAKVVDAHYGNKGVWKFVKDDLEENLKVDQLFKDAIGRLESGERVCLWDGQSTKVPSTAVHITKVKAAYVKFRYSAGIAETQTPKSIDVSDLESRLEDLKNMPPSKPLPLLARQKSACVPGFSGIKPVEERIDDLEERMQRLINLPNEVVFATHVIH
jgi:hypothetical protein